MEKDDKNKEKIENPEEVAKNKFMEEYDELREKYGYDLVPIMDFYEYKVLPDEVQLALVILKKHKIRYLFNLVEIKSKDDN